MYTEKYMQYLYDTRYDMGGLEHCIIPDWHLVIPNSNLSVFAPQTVDHFTSKLRSLLQLSGSPTKLYKYLMFTYTTHIDTRIRRYG